MFNVIYSAIFDSYGKAVNAVRNLRIASVDINDMSIVARDDCEITEVYGVGDDAAGAGNDIVGKAAAGTGIGALLGVAAMAIPGVGPFFAAVAIAQAAAGGAAIAVTAVGAAAGALSGALTDYGVSEEDAEYYAAELEKGGALVIVNTDGSNYDELVLSKALYGAGGHSSTHTRSV